MLENSDSASFKEPLLGFFEAHEKNVENLMQALSPFCSQIKLKYNSITKTV
jgi:hypothetical protein